MPLPSPDVRRADTAKGGAAEAGFASPTRWQRVRRHAAIVPILQSFAGEIGSPWVTAPQNGPCWAASPHDSLGADPTEYDDWWHLSAD